MNEYIKSLRLRTVPLSVAGIVLGSLYGWEMACVDWITFIFAVLCASSLQILSNLANELGDFRKGTDNDFRTGPHRGMQRGFISEHQMQIMIFMFGALSVVYGIVLLFSAFDSWLSRDFWMFIGFGAVAVVAALCYTLGKRPYGYSGFGDLFVFVFFGLLGTLGGYYLQHRVIDASILLLSVAMGMLSVAVLNVNNMRDVENDELSGKKTMVVRMGLRNAKFYHLFLIVVALVCAAVATGWTALAFAPVYAYHLYFIFVKDNSLYDTQMPLLTFSTLAYVIWLLFI